MWRNLSQPVLFMTVLFCAVSAEGEDEAKLRLPKNTADRIAEHGYPVETHSVVTEDGYILTMFRIPHSHRAPTVTTQRSVVFIMHGIFMTSDGWVLNGPDDGLPFILADAGHDVWLGNARGNHYSRNHTVKHVLEPSFWGFSFHEIGLYDLAAMIDYALATNAQQPQSLHYIGHSQGTTNLFVLLSSRPAYNNLVRTAHMLAPVSSISHSSNVLWRLLSSYLGQDSTYTRFLRRQEFVPFNEFLMLILFNTCGTQGPFHAICSRLIPWLPLLHQVRRYNESVVDSLMENGVSSISSDKILHFMQLYRGGEFRLFDFGRLENLKVYDQGEPPSYRLENIVSHLHLWYSDNDDMVAVEDVMRLALRLPHRMIHRVEDPLWSHGEFLFSLEVKQTINEPILKIISDYDANLGEE